MNLDDKDERVLLIASDFHAALANARDGPFAVEWVANLDQDQSSGALGRQLPLPDCRTADAGRNGTFRPTGAYFVTTG